MPGISGLTTRLSSRKIKYILFFCILFLVASLAAVFIRHRLDGGNASIISPPDTTDAVLAIQGFRHTASQNGKKQWTIEADSAQLYVDPSEARLIKILALFFSDNENTIKLTADRGILKLDTNNISVFGNVEITAPQYNIKTENLQYDQQSNIIETNSPVNVIGPTFRLNAEKMAYNVRTGKIECTGHVEGFFSGIIYNVPD